MGTLLLSSPWVLLSGVLLRTVCLGPWFLRTLWVLAVNVLFIQLEACLIRVCSLVSCRLMASVGVPSGRVLLLVVCMGIVGVTGVPVTSAEL